MKKIAYFECPTGIAGDMCLGALVAAGVPLDYLIEKLNTLGIADEYELRSEVVQRNGQVATKVYVDLQGSQKPSATIGELSVTDLQSADLAQDTHHHDHPRTDQQGGDFGHHHHHHHHHHHQHTDAGDRNPPDGSPNSLAHPPVRHLPEIERLIELADLPKRAKAWSLAIFRQLAVVEGAVHGMPPTQVHFHEVGATDAIVDIVGTCLGLDWLGIEQVYCSALPVGGGTVWVEHGQLPVPVPAVLKLLESRQVPIYSNGIEKELVTPTGAAIAIALATDFGDPPAMTLNRVGLGAGSANLSLPNILRLWIGQKGKHQPKKKHQKENKKHKAEKKLSSSSFLPQSSQDTISVLETQIDDLNPQAIGYLFEALFTAGALDVFTQPIGMKKSRPGILLTVICHPENKMACEALLFRETTTLGIRHFTQQRSILSREIQSLQTPLGTVRVKVATSHTGKIINVQPEYEDCAQLARQHQVSWREVHRIALQSWYVLPTFSNKKSGKPE